MHAIQSNAIQSMKFSPIGNAIQSNEFQTNAMQSNKFSPVQCNAVTVLS